MSDTSIENENKRPAEALAEERPTKKAKLDDEPEPVESPFKHVFTKEYLEKQAKEEGEITSPDEEEKEAPVEAKGKMHKVTLTLLTNDEAACWEVGAVVQALPATLGATGTTATITAVEPVA